ncbi:probable gluconokinase isoform X2 [Ambystoma mexicanum]|uniref:probable gluconokinase isoform X2 n=1 Tax=Ambystoma mexicanum TaxID=8296 RepID=UPI0037E75281
MLRREGCGGCKHVGRWGRHHLLFCFARVCCKEPNERAEGIRPNTRSTVGALLASQDRIPWLCLLHDIIKREESGGQSMVLACSALKKMYRNVLQHGKSTILAERDQPQRKTELPAEKALFVHLDGSKEVLSMRLKERQGHFMPTTLLQSQLDSLEPPSKPEHFVTISVQKKVSEIVTEIERTLNIK